MYAPTSKAEEAEVEEFYEDQQDLLELTPKKDILFFFFFFFVCFCFCFCFFNL